VNRPVNHDKRCFTFCGEDQCDCGAAVDFIVADVFANFRKRLKQILEDAKDLAAELPASTGGPDGR
jgi:hypothetical protein